MNNGKQVIFMIKILLMDDTIRHIFQVRMIKLKNVTLIFELLKMEIQQDSGQDFVFELKHL